MAHFGYVTRGQNGIDPPAAISLRNFRKPQSIRPKLDRSSEISGGVVLDTIPEAYKLLENSAHP